MTPEELELRITREIDASGLRPGIVAGVLNVMLATYNDLALTETDE